MKIDADAAGMDAERLSRIDEHLLRRYLEPGKIAGCQVAVMRRGALAHLSSMGYADRERTVHVTEDTIWRIYSMTKPITGVALMSLYEHGLFQLTDPVSRLIPEWANLQVRERDESGAERLVEPHRPMQIRDQWAPRCPSERGHTPDKARAPPQGRPHLSHRHADATASLPQCLDSR